MVNPGAVELYVLVVNTIPLSRVTLFCSTTNVTIRLMHDALGTLANWLPSGWLLGCPWTMLSSNRRSTRHGKMIAFIMYK